MSAFLTLSNLTLTAADGTPLVPAFDLAFGRERTGLVGPNGCGKSTLLARMAGPPGGPVGRGGSVALVGQSWPDLGLSVAEALEVAGGLDRLARLEAGQGGNEDFAEADWELPARLAAALARVGFGEEVLTRRLATLSGGQRTRVALARAILAAPDLLLLDEPTNNLDAEGRALVAELIAGWRGGVVVASHDRALLGAVDRIVELSPRGMRLTGGGYAAWAEARAAREAREAATLDRAERELARVEREVQRQREKKARRDAAGKASRAKGDQPKVLLDARAERAAKSGARERAVGRRLEASAEALLAGAEAQIHRRDPLRIEATAAEAHGAVLRAEGVTLRRDGFALGPFDLVVTAGERLALSGPNGAGKSTLLALLRGELMPERGEIHRAGAVAALDQHAEGFVPEVPLVESLRRLHPALTDNAARALLARFGFRNRAAERLAGTLSGGEKLRAGLAAALGGGAPPALLTLDEPTNHLDLETVALLEAALADYPGALLVVSHDRVFLEAIGVTRELTLGRGRLI